MAYFIFIIAFTNRKRTSKGGGYMASPFLCFYGFAVSVFLWACAETVVQNEIEVLQKYANLNACLHLQIQPLRKY